MRRLRVRPLLILFVCCAAVLAPALSAQEARPALDVAQLVPRRDSSRVLAEGREVGATVSILRRSGARLEYTEQSTLVGGFHEETTIVLDPKDASPRQFAQTITQKDRKAETRLTYEGGRVKGRGTALQPDGGVKEFKVDTAAAPGTYDVSSLPVVVPALPLAPGTSFTLRFFFTDDYSTKVLGFTVADSEPVTVPAGTFQAYRVEVSGSQLPFVLYVSTAAPRRVVKTQFVGQPYVAELVKD